MTTQTDRAHAAEVRASPRLDALATSMLASLGVPGEPNPLRLPAAERVCLLLVDGLGWELLQRASRPRRRSCPSWR